MSLKLPKVFREKMSIESELILVEVLEQPPNELGLGKDGNPDVPIETGLSPEPDIAQSETIYQAGGDSEETFPESLPGEDKEDLDDPEEPQEICPNCHKEIPPGESTIACPYCGVKKEGSELVSNPLVSIGHNL